MLRFEQLLLLLTTSLVLMVVYFQASGLLHRVTEVGAKFM